MIVDVMKNSALCAKVHAMKGKALNYTDYSIMMNMKSVPEVAAYLVENTGYKRALSGMSVSMIHRGDLETLLRQDLNTDVKRLLPYMSHGAKKFMQLTEIEEGMSILKVCCRYLSAGHREEIPECMEKLRLTGTVDKLPSVEIENIDMLIDAMEGTPYYGALNVFKNNPEKQKPFYIEMRLDTYWTKLVVKYLNKYLSVDEKRAVKKIYGTEVDIENLSFMLRCKKSFDMSDEEIYSCLFPWNYRITQEVIRDIVNAQSYNEALEIIKSRTPYGDAFSNTERLTDKAEREFILKTVSALFGTKQYSVLAPIDYVFMRRAEINNIISVTEGIRYGLSPEKIKGYLIERRDKGGSEE